MIGTTITTTTTTATTTTTIADRGTVLVDDPPRWAMDIAYIKVYNGWSIKVLGYRWH